MSDDELGDLIRAARPGTTSRHDPVPPHALRVLEEIMADERPHRAARRGSRRRRLVPLIGSGFAVLMVAVTVVALSLFNHAPAVAATPPLLQVTPVSGSASQLLAQLGDKRREASGATSTAVRGQAVIRFTQWALATNIGEDGEIESSQVEPTLWETAFQDDGSIHKRLTVAEPFPGDKTEELAEPGTLIDETVLEPGTDEYEQSYLPPEPPTDPDEVGAYLASLWAYESEPTLGEYFNEVVNILNNRIVTAEQEAAILTFLSRHPALQVDGRTTDRLGRPALVFRATDWQPGLWEELLIVSPDTGQILAAETIWVGDDRTDIASPSVSQYFAWERTD
ncbi:hypothetical protein [Microbacterium marinilacus]|uniref:CU044_5270 family protein n=1 Tax=Microbacterium marinilacus TaxID=415209 RepID=A0ABP7BFB4_9MICO|nr:hypothetical protein [Microbacterium marinilacus]MBY0689581.1 hypothetical protein [Microbacterium marinilacus]